MQRQLTLVLFIAQACFGFDLDVYKGQYQARVAVPYKMCVTITATNIVEYLAKSPVPMSAEAGRRVATLLNTQTDILSTSLNAADNSSTDLRAQLDQEHERLSALVAIDEQRIAVNQQQQEDTNQQIQINNAQTLSAQNRVNLAQQLLQKAQNSLNEEQHQVDEASNKCTYIGFCLDYQICQVVSKDTLHRREAAKTRAQTDLTNKQQRLAQLQAQGAQLQQKLAQLVQQRTNLEADKVQLNGQITQLNGARDQVVGVDTKLKGIVAQVATLLGKSPVLAQVVKTLLNTDTMIKPVIAAAEQIVSYSGNASDVVYLNSIKQKIQANFPMLQLKLIQYARIPAV